MRDVYSDPIRGILNIARGRGYAMTDLLDQSIALCIGFWFLEKETIHSLCNSSFCQADFEAAVRNRLKETDAEAEVSFAEYSQTHLLEDTFRELFYHWAQFSDDKDKLRRLTDRLVYPNLSRVRRPELAVPTWLERLACELLGDKTGTFYDGAAGVGNMALRIAQDRRKKGLPLHVVTKEIDPLLFHLSVLRSKMHGFAFQQTNEDCLNTRDISSKADMSVMFPSLRGGEQVFVSDSVVCGGDWSYAYHQLSALNKTGIGVCRIPNGALFNAKNQAFRKYLLDLNVIDAIIALPQNSVPFWPAAPATSLVVFRKGRKQGDTVWMMELPTPGLWKQKNENRSMFHHSGSDILPMIRTSGRQVDRFELDAFNLSPQRYLPTTRLSDMDINTVQNAGDSRSRSAIRMKEVAQIYRGINVANLVRSAEGAGVLRLSDVQNGKICMDNIAHFDLSGRENADRYQIRVGDILISCKGKAIKLCIISEDVPLYLSHDFLGIRADGAKVDPWYLYYVLQSPVGQKMLQQIQMGSSIPMIRAADLEQLRLHYIPLVQQSQYASELRGANVLIDEQLEVLNASRRRVCEQFYQKVGLEDVL